MITLRQTILNTYKVCALKCLKEWGEVGKQGKYEVEESPKNKYSACGIAFHEVMEYAGNSIKSGVRPPLDELKNMLNEKFEELPIELFDDEEDVVKWRESLQDQLEWSYEQCLQSNSILECEMHFEIRNMFKDMPIFTGCIDRVDGQLETKDIRLIDYKTGKVYTKKELNSNIQACLYSLAFMEKYGFLPKEFVFYFTKHKKKKVVPITTEFIENVSAEIMRIVYEMKNKNFEPTQTNKFFCKNFCAFQSECPKFKRSKKTGWALVNE